MLDVMSARAFLRALKPALGGVRQLIVDLLTDQPCRAFSMLEIIEAVYRGREPDQAQNSIQRTICLLRREGFNIVTHRGYSFVPRGVAAISQYVRKPGSARLGRPPLRRAA